MSYRKLTIDDGVKYDYVIGKTFTKVKRDGKSYMIFENSKIGNPCMGPGYGMTFVLTGNFVITPQNVRNAILGEGIPTNFCEYHNVRTTGMHVDPFENESYGNTLYVPNCPTCYENSAADI